VTVPSDRAQALGQLLGEARELGFLGPGAVDVGIEHARGFAAGLGTAPARLVDLGSGGGLPGLVLAGVWIDAVVLLVEANERRSRFLRHAVDVLGYGDRVQVIAERAELVGRRAELRGRNDVVVARAFGAPAVTAECGAPLLRVGGRLVVSEPPPTSAAEDRWPPGPLAELGLVLGSAWTTTFHYQSLDQVAPCPERYPRRVGVPAKRPLY
jgi:16S rRNA (guanine527-N7)-methyltransferase